MQTPCSLSSALKVSLSYRLFRILNGSAVPSSGVPVLLVICAICFLKPVKRDSGLTLMLKKD